jgi:sirohydrochlorin ferrochelatase
MKIIKTWGKKLGNYAGAKSEIETNSFVGQCSKSLTHKRAGLARGRARPRADPAALWRTLARGADPAGGESDRRPVTRGSLGTGLGYAGTLTAAQGVGLARWTLDALVRVGGWAEAVKGRPGLTSRGTDGP